MVGLGRLELPTSPLSGVLLFRKIPYRNWVSERWYFNCVPFCVPLVQQFCHEFGLAAKKFNLIY